MTDHPKECVWDYPRPPALEHVSWPIRIERDGFVIVDAPEAHRVLETTHPPVYYIAAEYVTDGCLRRSAQRSTGCEWKGRADYYDLVVPSGEVVEAVAWTYPNPTKRFADIRGAFAFYPSRVGECQVDGETVTAQDGDFYGGWITSWIDGGPRGFKGGPGTRGW